jgi:hypothetical protein
MWMLITVIAAGMAVVLFATHGIPRYDDAWSVGMGRGGGGLMREFQGIMQFIVPLVLAAMVQWLVVRTACRAGAIP